MAANGGEWEKHSTERKRKKTGSYHLTPCLRCILAQPGGEVTKTSGRKSHHDANAFALIEGLALGICHRHGPQRRAGEGDSQSNNQDRENSHLVGVNEARP